MNISFIDVSKIFIGIVSTDNFFLFNFNDAYYKVKHHSPSLITHLVFFSAISITLFSNNNTSNTMSYIMCAYKRYRTILNIENKIII